MIQATGNKSFHLMTKNTSYIIKVLPSGHLGSLYYGKRIRQKPNYDSLYQRFTLDVGIETRYAPEGEMSTLNTSCLEVATFGKSDFREPSLHVTLDNGSRVTDFLYDSYTIFEGKKELPHMPYFYQNEDEVTTLELVLKDQVAELELIMTYTVFYDKDVVTRSAKLINHSKPIVIDKIMSFNMDMPTGNLDLISLEGHWIKEKNIQRQRLQKGITTIGSKRLSSSAIHNPFLALVAPEATESMGNCYGYALVYSGNHQCTVELSSHDITRIQMGINSFDFSWHLPKGASFTTPEVVMTYSANGLNGMSQNFHQAIRENLIPKQWQYKERPILFNSWEAMYFDFDERKLMKLVKAGKELGMEMFVLDDGWFKGRNDDTTSLGDWFVDRKKLPGGLKRLSRRVKSQGLRFGLWVEPEMISVKSDLYEKHPEWAICLPDRAPSFGRNQLILDLCNDEVVDYLYKRLKAIFEEAGVDYVKWDMNRNGTDLYSNSLGKKDQGSISHRYYLGLYKLMDLLKNDFPNVLFESCASGGNRHDLGMLYYMPQTWASDNTDPGGRMRIQYGASLLFPQDTIAAHVGSNPSHQVLRNNSIETRFNVAAFGSLGYELNLTKLSSFDKKVVKKQVQWYKKHRKTLQFGTYSRLQSPFESNHSIVMVMDTEKKHGVLGYNQQVQYPNEGFEQIYLDGLVEDQWYKIATREHYMNIERFGELINEFIPIDLSTSGFKGLIHKTISDHYMFEGEQQSESGYGDEFMYAGFRPYHQFTGTGYNETTRYVGDFGSRLYTVSACKEPQKLLANKD